jgi:hypothetical protein
MSGMREEFLLMSSHDRDMLIIMSFALHTRTPKEVYEMYKPLYTLEELERIYKEVNRE